MRDFLTCFGIKSDHSRIEKVASYAVKQGYAVVPIRPGAKAPDLCTLTDREKKAAGDHLCGVHHAITDPKVAVRVFTRLGKAYGAPLNLGVVAWPSHLVVVDADSAEACHAFLSDWAEATGDPGYLEHTPTVHTPGACNAEGEWKHRDGGHWYFSIPEGVELELGRGVIKAAGGYDVRWGWSMTVVPPSTRAEGPYVPTGDVVDCPAHLLELIAADTERMHEKRILHGAHFVNDPIAAWSLTVEWADLLVPDGWSDTSKIEGCGCPIFEKPGGGSTTYKSATGHGADCARYENFEGHGPLHLWTTDPPAPLDEWLRVNGATLTKLQYVALTRYDGDVEVAKIGLGITPATVDWVASLPETPQEPREGPSEATEEPGATPPPGDQSRTREEPPPRDDPTAGFFRPDETQAFRDAVVARAREDEIRARATELRGFIIGGPGVRMSIRSVTEIEPVAIAPSIGHRTDSVALLYPGRVNTIWGPSDSAKSWFSLACAIDTVTCGGRAFIIDTEDDQAGFRYRADLLGAVHPGLRYVRLWALPDTLEREALMAEARAADLVVIDSLDGFLALHLLDSNAATAVRMAGATMKLWAQAGNAAVLVVDHSTEKGVPGQRSDTALGSSAKKQLIDGVMLRADRETRWKPFSTCRMMVMIGKDRHAWAKQHAEFDSTRPDSWGRLARLQMECPDGESTLKLLPPPSFAAEPYRQGIDLAEGDLMSERIIDFLVSKGEEWQTATDVLTAAGDKNGRKGERQVLADLVAGGWIEHEEQDRPKMPGHKRQMYRIKQVD